MKRNRIEIELLVLEILLTKGFKVVHVRCLKSRKEAGGRRRPKWLDHTCPCTVFSTGGRTTYRLMPIIRVRFCSANDMGYVPDLGCDRAIGTFIVTKSDILERMLGVGQPITACNHSKKLPANYMGSPSYNRHLTVRNLIITTRLLFDSFLLCVFFVFVS
jgi:hypothetical protein